MKGFRFKTGDKAKLDNFEVVVIGRIEEDGKLFYGVAPAKFSSVTRTVSEDRLERIDGNEEDLD